MSRRSPRSPGQRPLRVGEEVRHALSAIFARGDLREPALAGRSLTVTEVRLSPDLRNARVYVMPLGGGGDDEVLAGLGRSAPHLRARLAELVHMKFSPTLSFAFDSSFEVASRIDAVLRAPEVARDLGPASEEAPGENGRPHPPAADGKA